MNDMLVMLMRREGRWTCVIHDFHICYKFGLKVSGGNEYLLVLEKTESK